MESETYEKKISYNCILKIHNITKTSNIIMAQQFTDQTAQEAIASGKPVVIDFWATWCGPCIKLGPVVEELAEKYGDKAVIGKLNIDENDEVASANRVRNIPTVLFFKDGELKDRSVGLVKLSDLEAKLLPLL